MSKLLVISTSTFPTSTLIEVEKARRVEWEYKVGNITVIIKGLWRGSEQITVESSSIDSQRRTKTKNRPSSDYNLGN